MTNELANIDEKPPAWMIEKSVGAELGNLDASDYAPPRLKLIAATSKELESEPDARAGSFWLTGAKLNLGPEVIGTHIIVRKSKMLWSPSRESKAPLAISSDGIRWDPGYENQTFEVKYDNNPNVYTWRTKRSVAESGLDRWGSSRPEDNRSPPAASLTYFMLWALKLPGGGTTVALVINSRSAVKEAGDLFEMMKARGVDFYYQRYRICSVREKRKGFDTTYFTYRYFFHELIKDPEEGETYKRLHDNYRKAGFSSRPDDMEIPAREENVSVRKVVEGVFTLGEADDDNIPF